MNISAHAEAALSADRDADAAAADVSREFVNNALRHGRARTIRITVRLVGPSGTAPIGADTTRSAVVVDDDGSGWDAGSQPGLGNTLFDKLCTSWEHVASGSGTRVLALIGLGPSRDDHARSASCIERLSPDADPPAVAMVDTWARSLTPAEPL